MINLEFKQENEENIEDLEKPQQEPGILFGNSQKPPELNGELEQKYILMMYSKEDILPHLQHDFPTVFPLLSPSFIMTFKEYFDEKGPNSVEILKAIIDSNDDNRSKLVSSMFINQTIVDDLPVSIELIADLLSLPNSRTLQNHFVNYFTVHKLGLFATDPDPHINLVAARIFGLIYNADVLSLVEDDYGDNFNLFGSDEELEKIQSFNMVEIMKTLLESQYIEIKMEIVKNLRLYFSNRSDAISTLGFHFFKFCSHLGDDLDFNVECYRTLCYAFRAYLDDCIPKDEFKEFLIHIAEVIASPESEPIIAANAIYMCKEIIEHFKEHNSFRFDNYIPRESVLDKFGGTNIIESIMERLDIARAIDLESATRALCLLVDVSDNRGLMELRQMRIMRSMSIAQQNMDAMDNSVILPLIKSSKKLFVEISRLSEVTEEEAEIFGEFLDPLSELVNSDDKIISREAQHLLMMLDKFFNEKKA